MADWIERLQALHSETPPSELGTEEYIHLAELPLVDVYARLKEQGLSFADNKDLQWLKRNPKKEEARRYQTGGEFFFFGSGGGHYVERLKWDEKKGKFQQDTISITGMTAPIIWGSNRNQVDAIPRRVVFKR